MLTRKRKYAYFNDEHHDKSDGSDEVESELECDDVIIIAVKRKHAQLHGNDATDAQQDVK